MSSAQGNGTVDGASSSGVSPERQPLLGHTSNSAPLPQPNGLSPKPPSRLRRFFASPLSRRRADVVLLLCYLITGLLDSTSISTWGSFVSMQTGNTVYIGLGLAAPRESTRWIKSLTSLAAFCAGSFAFSRFHRAFGNPRRRVVLLASFAAQGLLILGAACIVTFHRGSAASRRALDPDSATSAAPTPAAESDLSWDVLVPVALLSLQACGQAAASRALAYPSLTSVVLTSIYCDLWGDARLFSRDNVERNRRVAAPTLLLIGAVAGGWFARSEWGMKGALWTAVALKTVTVLAWAGWPVDDTVGE